MQADGNQAFLLGSQGGTLVRTSRFEALWRTMIADVWDFQHPAPRAAGYAFVHSLVSSMLKVLKRHQRITSATEVIHPQGASGLVLDLFDGVSEGVRSDEGLQEDLLHRISALIALYKDEMTSMEHISQIDPYSLDGDFPFPYLFPIETSEDVLSYEVDEKQATEWAGTTRPHRRLFSTSTHKIGLGPKSLREDDEIWLLKGARYPFVLRRLENGNYQLVGESYIHGIMHGEALIFGDDLTFCDIVLE
jgi:hypothetical protein